MFDPRRVGEYRMEKRLSICGFGAKLWEKVGIKRLLQVMGKFFFSGSTSAKLDEKGRFVLPQQMRFGLVEEGVLEFSLALGLGGCLAIYRQSDIQKIVAKFQAKQHLGKYQKFFTLFFSTLYQTTCDKVGRVIIPPALKKAVGIKTDITIAGVLNKIEIWPKERYESQLEAVLSGQDSEMNLAKMTEEAFALMDEGQSGSNEQGNAGFFAVGRGLPNARHANAETITKPSMEGEGE
jgi:MraZ protein